MPIVMRIVAKPQSANRLFARVSLIFKAWPFRFNIIAYARNAEGICLKY